LVRFKDRPCPIFATERETPAPFSPQAAKPKAFAAKYARNGRAVDVQQRDTSNQTRSSAPAKSREAVMIDTLAFALAAVAVGIPAIITAAKLGSKLEFYW